MIVFSVIKRILLTIVLFSLTGGMMGCDMMKDKEFFDFESVKYNYDGGRIIVMLVGEYEESRIDGNKVTYRRSPYRFSIRYESSNIEAKEVEISGIRLMSASLEESIQFPTFSDNLFGPDYKNRKHGSATFGGLELPYVEYDFEFELSVNSGEKKKYQGTLKKSYKKETVLDLWEQLMGV